ncbi:MAG: lmo0937 family membrane protein [Acidobacteriaceae bacterium]
MRGKRMFLGLGILLLLLWLGGFFVFHVTAFFIHILLILAVVSIIFHFMRGATSAV